MQFYENNLKSLKRCAQMNAISFIDKMRQVYQQTMIYIIKESWQLGITYWFPWIFLVLVSKKTQVKFAWLELINQLLYIAECHICKFP